MIYTEKVTVLVFIIKGYGTHLVRLYDECHTKIDLFGFKSFSHQNCVKFVLFEVLTYIWYQNNQTFDQLSWNNPSVWCTWQHFHHDKICKNLFWTRNWSIVLQHSSYKDALKLANECPFVSEFWHAVLDHSLGESRALC